MAVVAAGIAAALLFTFLFLVLRDLSDLRSPMSFTGRVFSKYALLCLAVSLLFGLPLALLRKTRALLYGRFLSASLLGAGLYFLTVLAVFIWSLPLSHSLDYSELVAYLSCIVAGYAQGATLWWISAEGNLNRFLRGILVFLGGVITGTIVLLICLLILVLQSPMLSTPTEKLFSVLIGVIPMVFILVATLSAIITLTLSLIRKIYMIFHWRGPFATLFRGSLCLFLFLTAPLLVARSYSHPLLLESVFLSVLLAASAEVAAVVWLKKLLFQAPKKNQHQEQH